MKLYYEETGNGEPMVLLHGNGEDSSYFKNQVEYFSKNYRVIAVDTRGHGKSERGTAPFTLKQFAWDLKKFLDRMQLRDIILLGFSDGGNIALIFTILYPGYVKKLILNGANLNPSGMKMGIRKSIAVSYLKTMWRVKRGTCREKLLELMIKEPHISGAYLKQLNVPTLVIAGTRDMIKTGHTKKIHSLIPASRLCLVEGTHFIASENSLEFNQAVERFLNQTGRKEDGR